MSEHRPTNATPEHDDRDIDANAIVKFAVALVASTGLAMFAMWIADEHLVASEEASHRPASAFAAERPDAPPSPRLETSSGAEWREFRAVQKTRLDSYGYLDRQNGVVHIPIEKAMDLVVQRGLAARSAPPPETPVALPTESGLGLPRSGGKAK